MNDKEDKQIIKLIAENGGMIRKQKLYYHFQKDHKRYTQAVSRLTTRGLIWEDRAVYKLTPEAYDLLKFKINWKIILSIISVLLTAIGLYLAYF